MSDGILLELETREDVGKKVAALRKNGYIPGVVYGHSFKATNVQAPQVPLIKVVQKAGKHHLVDLVIDGKKQQSLIKSIDIDPVKNKIRHVSFYVVRQNEKIETEIPIKLLGEGESEAERAGLVVLKTLDSLKVRALPRDLPDVLEVDITHLTDPGQTVTIADLTDIKGVEIIEEDTAITVANVYEPSALAAANEAAGGDAESEDDVASEHGEGEESPSEDGEDSKATDENKS